MKRPTTLRPLAAFTTVAELQPGQGSVLLSVPGAVFAQPAHLNVRIRRLTDDAGMPLSIQKFQVVQSFDGKADDQ